MNQKYGGDRPWFEKNSVYEVIKDVSLSDALKDIPECAPSFEPGERVLFDHVHDNSHDGWVSYCFSARSKNNEHKYFKYITLGYRDLVPDWAQYFRKI